MGHGRRGRDESMRPAWPWISSACWNVGRFTHSISGWVITPIGRNWIESEHIWSPAAHTLSGRIDLLRGLADRLAERCLERCPAPRQRAATAIHAVQRTGTLSSRPARRSFWTMP